MEGAPVPFKPKPYVEHKLGLSTTFDAGRGCPFQCSFYTIIMLVTFATTAQLENVHPLEGGIFRLKHPSERRAGLPRERAFIFWPRFVWDTISKHAVIVATIARLLVLKFVITRDPAARVYKDTALTPVSDDEETTLDLLTHTTGAHAAVTRFKKIARLTGVARVV
jgi:hypothetical protein